METTSRRKHGSHSYRHSRDTRENEYEFDINDISRASTPTSTFSSKSEGRKREREHRYSIDDYKRKIARLKSELDLEKAKSKKAHKEKSSELREVRESYEMQKQAEIDELEHKLKRRLEKERRQLEENIRNSVNEEKDKEVQEVLKYKEDEVKEMRKKYRHEKEAAIKLALENEKAVVAEKERKFNEELEKMKAEKEKLEENYKKKCADEARKEKEFMKIKEEYDAELRRILGESKKLALGNLEKLKKAEKALIENTGESDDELHDEIDFSDLISDLHTIHSQTSSRAVSRSVSTTSELKWEDINSNINTLLASPAVTPGPSVTPGAVTPGLQGHGDRESPATVAMTKELSADGKPRSSSAMSEPARELFSRKLDERDRQLQKRVTELQTQTQRLERKIALLKTENETLKRKQDDKKPLEEKIKTLKKRNAELAAIARRLEEKAKHLQAENVKKTKELVGQQSPAGVDQMKKMFARQRAKDFAEHAKSMLAKDREIEELRKKCQELADQLSNADFLGPENSEMYEEKEELVTIIKQAAKERLELERQLAVVKPGPDSKVVSAEKFKEIEETNETLKKEIAKLERALSDTERLEIELTQKKLECERLTRDIQEERVRTSELETALSDSTSHNRELSERVHNLQHRLADLEKVNEECSTLRLSLSEAQHECEVAKGEVAVLQLKVTNLETVVKNLEFSTSKLKQVEEDYNHAVVKLQEKQGQIDQLQKVQESAREKYETAIKGLQEKIRALETQCSQQAVRQQELTDELTQLRAQTAKHSARESRTTEIQTGQSIEFAPSATSSPNQSPRISPGSHSNNVNSVRKSSPVIAKSPALSIKSSPISSQTPSSAVAKLHNSSAKVTSPAQELIQPLQASPSLESTPSKPRQTTPTLHQTTPTPTHQTPPPSQPQPISTPLHNSSGKKGRASVDQTESIKSGTDTGFADDDEVTQSISPDPDKADFEDPELFEIAKKLKELEVQSDTSEDYSKADKGEDSGMESRGDQRPERDALSEMSVGDSRLSALGKKGPIQVYLARYSYDPHKYSPNENPEAELPLQAGDYVLVYGEMDEDGFFDGELVTGRRGLVPSNFIEKVADEDLPDFHAAMAMLGNHDDSTVADSVPDQDFDDSGEDEVDKNDLALEIPQLRAEPLSDLEDIEEEEEEATAKTTLKRADSYTGAPLPKNPKLNHQQANRKTSESQTFKNGAPFPKNLQLDRQLANSILVSWQPPDNIPAADIRSYHVFLDGDFKTAVRVGERTKTLLENVESRKIHRVSVRCVSSMGKSHDNQCTILVGKGVLPAPFDLRVTEVTANSAVVSWTPGDSSFHHAVFVNNVEVRVVKPAVFSHTLTGLNPATSHKVSIQAKNLTGHKEDNNIKPEHLTSTVEFTTAKGGTPDPPVNVQVEMGPQEGSILVTWLPVTIDTSGFSNGAVVSGYMVYADGQIAKEAAGATNDHVILTANDFHGFIPTELVVRTVSKDRNESADSETVRLPQMLIKEITVGAAKTIAVDAAKKVRKSPLHGSRDEDDIDIAMEEINKSHIISGNYQEAFYDSSCSELSDIPEVEEIESPVEPTNEKTPLKDTLHSLVNGLSGLTNESSDFEEIYQSNLRKEMNAETAPVLHDGRSPRSSLSETTPRKSRTSPAHEKRERSFEKHVSPKTVPQIEITRESSVDSQTSHKELLKADSVDSSKSSKPSTQQTSDKTSSKYSANMDTRDGYRECETDNQNSHPHRQHNNYNHNHQNHDTSLDISRKDGVSPRENGTPRASASPRDRDSRTPRGEASPRSREHKLPQASSPTSGGSRGLSPKGAQKTSPRRQGSPGDRDKHERYSGSSPRHGSHERHRSKSPMPSPEGKPGMGNDLIVPDSDMYDDEGGDVDSISGEINPPIDDNRVRLFVALFDYDPESMSPNVESLDEELPFREGQILKVFGDKDADGFYRGECGGRIGYIPCNMVSEIQVDDPELEEQLMKEVQENGTMATSSVTAQLSASDKYLKPIQNNGVHLSPTSVAMVAGEMAVRRMVAIYDYDPQELSPNVDAEVELSFKVGDIIITYGEMDDDGFYVAELNGQRGLVPSNFLQETSASDDEALDSVSVVTPARSGESLNTTDSRKSEKSERVSNKQQQQQPTQSQQEPKSPKRSQQHQQQQRGGVRSPGVSESPVKRAHPAVPETQPSQVELDSHELSMSRPRSLTPDELKQRKKTGGIFSKGKNIFKKFTR